MRPCRFAGSCLPGHPDEDYLYKAFEFSERSKSTLLLSSIQSNSAISVGGIPESIGHKEKDLLREISVTEEMIYEEEQKITCRMHRNC